MFRGSSFSLSEAIAFSSVTIAVKYKKEPPRYSSAKSSSGRRMEEEMVHLCLILAMCKQHQLSLGPASFFVQGAKRMPGAAITKSIVSKEPGRKTEEIFVDVIEKISVTFSSSGYILSSEIDGTIQMKSYLGGNPEIRLALNNDLSVGRDYSASRSGGVILDDCNFHELVHLHSFDVDRTLTMVAPEGELHVMNYSITKAELIVKVRADFSSAITANTVLVEIPVPPYINREMKNVYGKMLVMRR
ncbi:hypothetical protein K2173_007406 [Erythroxylum novogranatense]|uniref:MHD domain-containing protein n=1 Tax=Erythroxylum novogranatense TaxID=1862640 RepID=A0AAV8T660_9ROSI|nr:hypothetical protein K2173_007406 [Erythroxylum novogranatense]